MKKLIRFLSSPGFWIILYFVVVIGLPTYFFAKPVKKMVIKTFIFKQDPQADKKIYLHEKTPIKKKV